ncbi:hypothetical protein SESBI_21852 [Sesbania bispinosa]|nr:hypothetical protein SESBI_21852 [Sesbania bispinosa]
MDVASRSSVAQSCGHGFASPPQFHQKQPHVIGHHYPSFFPHRRSAHRRTLLFGLHVAVAQTHLSIVAAAQNDPSTVVLAQIRHASH